MKSFLILLICLLFCLSKKSEIRIFPMKTNEQVLFQSNKPLSETFQSTISNKLVIKPSILFEELEKRKSENTKLKPTELAQIANELIPKYGVNFWVDLSGLIEKKTKSKQIIDLADGNVRINFLLNLSNSTRKSFQIDSPTDSCCCGYAYADFPVSKITSDKMTVIINGESYEIKRSKEISFSQEHILIDNETKSKKIRSWQVPFEMSPFGISGDGKNLYIKSENEEILLEISENGNLKFVPKDFPNLLTNGKDLRRFPEPKLGEILYKSGETGLMLFKSANKQYIIDFPYVCT